MRTPLACISTSPKPRRRLWILLPAIVIALGFGFWKATQSIEQRVASEIRGRLVYAIDHCKTCRVKTSLGLRDIVRGRVTSVAVSATGVNLREGIVAEKLSAILEGVRIDLVRKELKGVDKAWFSFSITKDQLTSYLARRYPYTKLSLELQNGYVSIAASATIRGKDVWIVADLVPTVQQGTQVVLLVKRVLCSVSLPSQVVRQYIESKINPVLDTSKTKLPGRLTSVAVTPKFVTVTGSGSLKTLRLLGKAEGYSSESMPD